MPPVKPFPPGPGQESVWDYPRPPRLEPTTKHIQIVVAGITLVDTRRALRVLETSHPPVYYVPPVDVQMTYLTPVDGHSFCEFKGQASYYAITINGRTIDRAAWYYPDPTPPYGALRDFIAFYPGKMDACTVDGETVRPQAGGFYGGWITNEIVGPFKGEPGTQGW
jgi:uncharacterized protein (DUF427 family)